MMYILIRVSQLLLRVRIHPEFTKSSPSFSPGIGDGGNELGMGSLKEKVKALMPNGSLIACDVPADYAVTAGKNQFKLSMTPW